MLVKIEEFIHKKKKKSDKIKLKWKARRIY